MSTTPIAVAVWIEQLAGENVAAVHDALSATVSGTVSTKTVPRGSAIALMSLISVGFCTRSAMDAGSVASRS